MVTPRRKKIRLDRAAYQIPGQPCHLTICCGEATAPFGDRTLAEECVRLLVDEARRHAVALVTYCLMPDHLHVLAFLHGDGDLVRFIQAVKSKMTLAFWKQGNTGQLWQRSFYDHFLRRDEDVETAARYIVANPVRRGLVEDPESYAFWGSTVWTREDLLA